jgi:hypothetical protein
MVGHKHSFNLDFPVSPYIGDVLNASIIIIGANGGYRSDLTPSEFPNQEAIDSYVARVRDPARSDWSFVSKYYDRVNYGSLLADGRAALVNACAYRSPKITEEPDNKRLIKLLASVAFTRRWLLDVVLNLAQSGQRLLIAKRPGLWQLPSHVFECANVVKEPAPVSAQLTSGPWAAVQNWLETHKKQPA